MSISSAGSTPGRRAARRSPTRLISAYQRDLQRPRVCGSCSLGGTGVHRRAEGRRDTGQRLAEQQPRPGLDFHRMRAAAPQADGLHVLQRDERAAASHPSRTGPQARRSALACPVNSSSRSAGCMIQTWLRGSDTVAASRRPSSAKKRTGSAWSTTRSSAARSSRADERDEDGAYRPVQRVGGLRCRLGRAHPHGAALHSAGLAVCGDPPPSDTVRRVADGRQQHMDALAVGVERDPRLRLAPDADAVAVAVRTCRPWSGRGVRPRAPL